MERIVVVGNPGAGKSTLANELGRRRHSPVTHLDQLYWRAGCPERMSWAFLSHQWSYPRDEAPKVAAFLAEYGIPDEHVVRLTSPCAVTEWLATIPAR